jgi:hypothetical protein
MDRRRLRMTITPKGKEGLAIIIKEVEDLGGV